MATIKSYTDIPQSRKLAKILPLESADGFYAANVIITEPYITYLNGERYIPGYKGAIPCWSLTALLGVLPFHLIINNQRYAFSMHKGLDKDGETYMLRYNVFNTDVCLYKTEYYNNPIDACVAMIEKLNELKML